MDSTCPIRSAETGNNFSNHSDVEAIKNFLSEVGTRYAERSWKGNDEVELLSIINSVPQ